MKRCVYIVVAVLLLVMDSLPASNVKNIGISSVNGAVIARIEVDGPIRFIHETEIPKNGKPHRVIIDVLSAIHDLPAKNFADLPLCPITSIRTSQFSVKPEQIVRLVFDMTGAPFYQIDTEGKAILVTFPDKTVKPFAAWSSAKTPAQNQPAKRASTTVAKQSRAIEKDRQVSISDTKTQAPAVVAATGPAARQPLLDKPVSKKDHPQVTQEKSVSPVVTVPIAKPKTFAKLDGPPERGISGPRHGAPAKPKTLKPKAISDSHDKLAEVDVPSNREQKTGSKKASQQKVQAAPKTLSAPSTKLAASADKSVPAKSVKKKSVAKLSSPPPSKIKKQKENKTSSGQQALTQLLKSDKKAQSPKADDASSKVTTTNVERKTPAKSSKPTPAKKVMSEKPASKAVAKAASQKPVKTKIASPAVPSPDKSGALAASSTTSAGVKPAVKARATSRFRRTPSEIKGTMVAEFPKRLVVKYKPKLSRDPFEALVNKTRSYSGPIEVRIPNVEGLNLVGIIESSGTGNRALLEDAHGYSYILKSGDKVKKGYVLRVESDRIYFQIFEYGWSRTAALALEEY
jgi:hypothetical protein